SLPHRCHRRQIRWRNNPPLPLQPPTPPTPPTPTTPANPPSTTHGWKALRPAGPSPTAFKMRKTSCTPLTPNRVRSSPKLSVPHTCSLFPTAVRNSGRWLIRSCLRVPACRVPPPRVCSACSARLVRQVFSPPFRSPVPIARFLSFLGLSRFPLRTVLRWFPLWCFHFALCL